MKLVLASTSPRRRDLLQTLRIPFEVIPPTFKETATDLSPSEEVLYFAERKARSVRVKCPGALILAGDTLIDCDGEKIGKPRHEREAEEILKKLAGKRHRVLTAVVLLDTRDGSLRKHLEEVEVTFRPMSESEIRNYIATGESFGKAGGYAIQGRARAFITNIQGEEEAAIGLPLRVTREWLGLLT